ncbi:MAG: esterase-like activity of phytase family protein, partial [Thermomicrobiales bacterium]
IDPVSGALFYTSEGSEKLQIDPFVAATSTDGHFIAQPQTPAMFQMSRDGLTGPRDNLVFEGLSFDADGQSLWLAMECPLHQDGPTPTFTTGGVTRITNMDRTGTVLGQFAYKLDPLPGKDLGGYFGTGVTEILAVDATHFLVIERAFVADAEGKGTNTIKIYEIDTTGATDVKSQQWLATGGYTPVSKTLVLDLAQAGVTPIDNVEGITWGPTLANGNRTLVLVSDNNFNDTQVTEFIAVEVAS